MSSLRPFDQQVFRPHEKNLASVALSVAVRRLLEGEVNHSVDDGGLVATKGTHGPSLPRIVIIDACSSNLKMKFHGQKQPEVHN